MKNPNRLIALLLTASMFSSAAVPVAAAETMQELSTDESSNPSADDESIRIQTNMKNSVHITDEIAKNNSSANIMFSPISLNFALGMVAEGASGETKEAFDKFLGTDDYGAFAQKYMQYISERNSTEEEEKNGYKQKIKLANAIWANKNWTLKEAFCQNTESLFNAKIENLDFSDSENASSIINDWTDEQTEHLIPEIVSPDLLSDETGLVLTNSLYFESPWSGKAWEKTGVKETFHGLTQKEDVEYMLSEAEGYYENEYATAFSRFYQNGLQFVGILPKQEGDFRLEDLDIPGLLESVPEYSTVNCKMPALDFSTSVSLEDTLSDLGLEVAFSDEADFSQISDTPAKIDSIIQKTNLQLDENGTKAAAVTAILMEKCALMPEEPDLIKEVTLDRPFAFLIYDSENQETLFMGKVITTSK